MKRIISVILVGVLTASAASADNLTQKNSGKANAIIEAALEAHGGPDRLRNLETLVVQFEGIDHAVDQSRSAEPPWDRSEASGLSAIDLENGMFVTRAVNTGGGFETHQGTIINGDDSYQLDFRAGTIARIMEPDFETASGPLIRVTPALLVRTLADRAANAYYLGESSIDDEDYDVVGFSMTVGPAITMYFDKNDHLLRRSERLFAGAGLVQYEFLDYEQVDGIPFNQQFKLLLNGDINSEREVVSTTINEPIDDLLVVDSGLETVSPVEPDPLSRQEITDGVWLIGGSRTYAMFVDMGDYVFAAGATAGARARIESLREVTGDKPLRYAMLTHHHFDHVMGVSAYEAEGATLIASRTHERIARRAADNPDSLKLETVSGNLTLEGEGRTVEIIDIGPTAHTEHLLVAYLPEEGILFEADHFALPQNGTIPPAVSSTRSFAEAIHRNELVVRKFLAAHSPRVGTMDDLRTALEKEIFQASR